ncbi:hypothetical protein EXN66_Car018624 [Channa argus]|uniref:Uncharacterized protein n=1 Tax=Channa argus TaxID=215402 RepID=A0A6G1QLG2_CHAAH|nr:hypothetical protein EXN66_Car018624 [Channa argus]
MTNPPSYKLLTHVHTPTLFFLLNLLAGLVAVTELSYLCQAAARAKRIIQRELTEKNQA